MATILAGTIIIFIYGQQMFEEGEGITISGGTAQEEADQKSGSAQDDEADDAGDPEVGDDE